MAVGQTVEGSGVQGLRWIKLAASDPVVAVLRCCADEKQSARIVDLVWNLRAALVFIHNRVFCTDAFLTRTKNTVGARSAQ